MKKENKKALETKICPRCGARLFSFDVIDDRGSALNEYFELKNPVCGHSYIFSVKELKAIKQEIVSVKKSTQEVSG
jgi:predicted nucleic-acid-binding Zn-ribbon protein